MHEISVLQSTVDLARQVASDNGVEKISYLTLEVGELSGYLPVFFHKYWPVVTEGIPLFDGAELRIIQKPGEALCLDCGAMYNVMRQEGVCPNCGSRNKRVLGGKEYILKEIGYVPESSGKE